MSSNFNNINTLTTASLSSGCRRRVSPLNKQRIRDVVVLLIFILITGISITQIPKINVDSSTEVFIPQNHEIKLINDLIEEEFGSMDSIIMGVQVNFGSVLETEVLGLIADITAELESHPNVERVLSLTNLDYMSGTDEGLDVIPVLEDFTTSGIKDFKRRLVDWQEVYSGTFISEDQRLAAVIVQPNAGTTDEQNQDIYMKMREIADRNSSTNLHFPIAGFPVVKKEINRSIMSDIYWLIPIAAFLILLILFLSFRRWEGVIFPLLALALAALWVMGIIGFLGITFTMATLLVPVLLLVVGSAYGIHVLSHFFEEVSHKSGFLDAGAVSGILKLNLKNILIPVLLAGLTTAGGFLSLVSSPLGPFRTFGILSAVGVVCSQLAALILIPILLRLRYRKGIDTVKFHKEKNKEIRTKTSITFIVFEQIVRKGRWIVGGVSLFLVALTIAVLPQVKVGTDMIKFFGPDSSVVKDTEVFNTYLGGSNVVTVMLTAPEKGDILEPSFLKDVEKFETYIKKESAAALNVQTVVPNIKRLNQLMNVNTIPYAKVETTEDSDFFSDDGFFGSDDLFGEEDSSVFFDDSFEEGNSDFSAAEESEITEKTVVEETFTTAEFSALIKESYLSAGINASVDDVIHEMLAKSNYDGTAFYEVPLEPEKYGFEEEDELKDLISQYLMFYSGNLSMVINDSLEPDRTLITIQVSDVSFAAQKELRKKINAFWDFHIPEGWKYEVGGGATLTYVLSALVTKSQYFSLFGALLIVWLIVSIMFKSPIAGLFGMIPVAFALIGIFLFMVICNFQLDIITSLLASLAIGIGVDYAIHFMNAYKRHFNNGTKNSLNAVYRTTGKAIFINAVSVAFGFMSLLISQFVPIKQMGILFAVAMIFACLSSLIVLPMALIHIKPKFLTIKE